MFFQSKKKSWKKFASGNYLKRGENRKNIFPQKIIPVSENCRRKIVVGILSSEYCRIGILSSENCRIGKLSHRNIVAIADFGILSHRKIVASEYCRIFHRTWANKIRHQSLGHRTSANQNVYLIRVVTIIPYCCSCRTLRQRAGRTTAIAASELSMVTP